MAGTMIHGGGFSEVIFPPEYHYVCVKQRWADEWTWIPYLWPNESRENVWPEISNATFVWEYGEFVTLFGEPGAVAIPLSLRDWFISIWTSTVYGDYLAWVGVVTAEGLKVEGIDSVTAVDRGVQVIRAHGLEYLLRTRIIRGTYVTDPESGAVVYLPRTRAANKRYGNGLTLMGNRSEEVDPGEGVHTFSNDGDVWNNRQLAEHLLHFFGSPEVPMALSGQLEMLEQVEREWDFDGKDLYGALEDLIDRKRGMLAHIVTSGEGTVYIEVLSIAQEAVSAEGVSLPANPLQTDIEVGNTPHVDLQISIDGVNAYDEIIVRSAEPIKTVFTAGFDDGTLEEGWTAEEEDAFVTAEDVERTSDAFARVFSFFRVPKSFGWEGVAPYVDENGYVDAEGQGAFWNTDVRLERYLLWLEEAGENETEPEFVEPFGVILTGTGEFEEEEEVQVYSMLDKLELLDKASVSMRMADQEFGVVLRSRANQILALNHWPEETVGAVSPVYDYEDLLLTLCVKCDEVLQVVLPVFNGGWESPLGKQVVLTVPGIECWIIAPNTVVDVEAGELVIYDGEPVLRDDSEKLRAIAYLAWVWYGQQRATIDFTIKNNLNWFAVGTLVNNVVNGLSWERVGTVVTSIQRNYTTNEQVVCTGWSELDPQEFLQGL